MFQRRSLKNTLRSSFAEKMCLNRVSQACHSYWAYLTSTTSPLYVRRGLIYLILDQVEVIVNSRRSGASLKAGAFKERCTSCLDAFWSDVPLEIEQGFDCLSSVISRFLMLRFKNLSEHQIEDATHDALLKIHRAGQKSIVRSCSTYVMQVAKNAAISLIRMETRHTDKRVAEDQLAFEDSDAALVMDDKIDKIQLIHAAEDLVLLIEEHINGVDDQAIILGLANGNSYEEIGAQIGRTKGAVATRASLIRKKLQDLFKKHFPQDMRS